MAQIKDKKAIVAELTEKFKKADTLIFAEYATLSVQEIEELRKRLESEGLEFKIAKNTLARIAAKDAGLGDFKPALKGPIGIAISYTDPVAPARITGKYLKEIKKGQLVGGYTAGKLEGKDVADALMNLPPREILLANIAGLFAAPMAGFAYALDALEKQRTGPVEAEATEA